MRRAAFILAGLAACAAPALALSYLSANEARKTFFSYDMAGYLEGAKEKWRECIQANGTTSYYFIGGWDEGRLRVRDDGLLCFSYKSTDFKREACFTAQRQGNGWRFVDEKDPTTVFIATRGQKVRTCPTGDVPIS